MKKLFCIISISSVMLYSCGNSSENQVADEGGAGMIEGMETDLTTFGMPYSIVVPKGDNETEVLANDWGGIEIRKGEGYMVSIGFGEGDLARFKSDLNGDLLYKSTILNEGENFIVYKREIEGSGMAPEFHFMYIAKFGSDVLEIQNMKDVIFTEEAIGKMYASAQSLKPKTAG